ncbi:hypothetical protein [Staphylococcus aureus]
MPVDKYFYHWDFYA